MAIAIIGNNTGDDYSGTEDAFITNNNGSANYGASEHLYVWNVNPYANSLIRFTGISSLPAGITVSSASLFVFNANNETNTYHYILKRLLRAWGEGDNSGATADAGESCWDYYASSNSWTTRGGLSDGNDRSSTTTATFVSPVNNAYCEWTSSQLADDIQDFYDGTYSNNGWQVSSSDCQWGGFKSREYTDGYRPYLSVTYTESSSGNAYYYQQQQM
jgi:hypothetical protein